MIKTMLFTLAGPYISTLSLIPRAFAVEAKNFSNKSLVNLKERGKSTLLDQNASKQNEPVLIIEPVFKLIRSIQSAPFNSKGVFESKEIQREEVGVYSETDKNIDVLRQKNVSLKEDIAEDYFKDNLEEKPADTKSSGISRVEEEQKNYPHNIYDVTIQKNVSHKEDNIAKDYFNDNLDGKPTDTKSSSTSRIEEEQKNYPHNIFDVTIQKNVSHKEDNVAKNYFIDNLDGKRTDTISSGTSRIAEEQKKYSHNIFDVTIQKNLSHKEDNVAKDYFSGNLDGKPTDTKSSSTSPIEEEQKHYPHNIFDVTIQKNVSYKEDNVAKDYFNDNVDGKPTDTKSSGTSRIAEDQKNYYHEILDVKIQKNVTHKEDKDYFNDNLDGKPIDTKSSSTSQIENEQKNYSHKIFDVTIQKNNSPKKDMAKYYFNDNLEVDEKPTDAKSFSASRVDEEQINDPIKILDITTPDIDLEEDFFNDYSDGEKNDPMIKYKQTLIDGYSPYVQRLLFNERETTDTMAPTMKNLSYDKTEKPPTGKNKTYEDLAKLCLNSSKNFAQKLAGPVYSNNYTKDVNGHPVPAVLLINSKITKNDKPPTETNTFGELAKRFLNSTMINHLKEAKPVIKNIKLTSKYQQNRPAQPNVPNNRKTYENINPPMGISNRYGKSRIPKTNTKSFLNEIEVNKKFDDIAKRCLKLPINKVDEIILELIAKPYYKQKHPNPCMKKKGKT